MVFASHSRSSTRPGGDRGLFARLAASPRIPETLDLFISIYGRGASSKTSTVTAISDRVVDDFFPCSDLTLGFSDPLVGNEHRRQRELRLEVARRSGMPQSLERSRFECDLLHGERAIAHVRLGDEIGQDFSNISSTSSQDDRARHRQVQGEMREMGTGGVAMEDLQQEDLDGCHRSQHTLTPGWIADGSTRLKNRLGFQGRGTRIAELSKDAVQTCEHGCELPRGLGMLPVLLGVNTAINLAKPFRTNHLGLTTCHSAFTPWTTA